MHARIVRFARLLALFAGLLAGLLAVLAPAAIAPGHAQQPAAQQSPAPQSETQQAGQTPLAELEPMKLALDQIQATLRREDLSVETLGDLETSLTPVRDNLRAKLAD